MLVISWQDSLSSASAEQTILWWAGRGHPSRELELLCCDAIREPANGDPDDGGFARHRKKSGQALVWRCAGGEEAAKSKLNVSGPSVVNTSRPSVFAARRSRRRSVSLFMIVCAQPTERRISCQRPAARYRCQPLLGSFFGYHPSSEDRLNRLWRLRLPTPAPCVAASGFA
jgi:hypothetical protein